MTKGLFIILTAMVAALGTCYAQISVTSRGAGPITFDTQPLASEWSTRSIGGSAGDIVNPSQMDAFVAGETAAALNVQLQSAAGTPPNATGSPQWARDGHYLITRPAGTKAQALMATLRNDTGQILNSMIISYTLGREFMISEELPGHRVYYSTTGSAPWANVAALNGDRAPGTKTIPLDLSGSPWAAGSLLYVLWMDDNGASSPDDALELDNFSVCVLTCVSITAPADGSSFPSGSRIAMSAATASPGAITSIDYMEGANLIESASTPPFGVTTSSLNVGDHTIVAVSHDSLGNVQNSASITVHVTQNQPPTITAVTNNRAADHVFVGTNLLYTVVAADDGFVTNVTFLVDGIHRWDDSSSPFQYGWDDVTAGTHTLQVIATDNSGFSTTNDSTLVVTNPPNTTILLANGQSWKYWDQGVEPNDGDWRLPGYSDNAWSNGVAEIGYGDTDASRPKITLSRQISGGVTNATQLFRKKFALVASDLSFATGAVVRLMADDGGIVYLNGTEIYRSGNLTGIVSFASLASAPTLNDGSAFLQGQFNKNLLVAGENTVTVEIHQESLTSPDLSFDLMIWAQNGQGPRLRIERLPASPAFLVSWTEHGALQYNLNLGDRNGWASIVEYQDDGSHEQTINPYDNLQIFFRIQQ